MNYDGWLKTVPVEITGDALWQVEAYRLALFLAEPTGLLRVVPLPEITDHGSRITAHAL